MSLNQESTARAISGQGGLWIVSPMGLAMLAFLLFLLAWLFPPDIYSEYMQERDLMFLDPRAMLFFLLCIGGFWLGQWLLEVFSPSARVGQSMTPKWISRTAFLALPLARRISRKRHGTEPNSKPAPAAHCLSHIRSGQ